MKATLETIFKKNQIKATHTIHASIFFFSGNHASFVFNSIHVFFTLTLLLLI